MVGRWPLSAGQLCVGRHDYMLCGAAAWSVLRANVTPSFRSLSPPLPGTHKARQRGGGGGEIEAEALPVRVQIGTQEGL